MSIPPSALPRLKRKDEMSNCIIIIKNHLKNVHSRPISHLTQGIKPSSCKIDLISSSNCFPFWTELAILYVKKISLVLSH